MNQENVLLRLKEINPGWFLMILAAFLVGYWFRGEGVPRDSEQLTSVNTMSEDVQTYTCSMHPQIRNPGPGQCPLCGMALIPLESDEGQSLSFREIELSETARRLARVQTAAAERKWVTAEVRLTGKFDYAETRMKSISARIPGRLDRLYVDYTGIAVRQGDHLVSLYSPELQTAQRELLEAVRAVRDAGNHGSSPFRNTAEQTLRSVREKLRLWGLTEEQIEAVENRSEPTDNMTLYSPMSGIVVEKHQVEGNYVETGSPIYTIADLSQVWLLLDAYESDLQWIRFGQKVEIDTDAYPGQIFEGRIAFISPVLNPLTRTVQVRVNVSNEDGRLKPGLFARGRVQARVASGGRVIAPDFQGKWISPMHPEVVKDSPGKCDVCGMPLVRAEQLGYAGEALVQPPLVIPESAPLVTGKRAVVYVEDRDRRGIFEFRQIRLGPKTGDSYVVMAGLEEGEEVVYHGAFKIDSEAQIRGKLSMMNPEGNRVGAGQSGHVHLMADFEHEGTDHRMESRPEPERKDTAGSVKGLGLLLNGYYQIQKALSQDDLPSARKAAGETKKLLLEVVADPIAEKTWREIEKDIGRTLESLMSSQEINPAREAFLPLSESLLHSVRIWGEHLQVPVYRVHCPMAFEWKGADWLQSRQDIENPYFGSTMFRCGTVEEQLIEAAGGESAR